MERRSFEKHAGPIHNLAPVIPQDPTTTMTLFVLWSSWKMLPSCLITFRCSSSFSGVKGCCKGVSVMDSRLARISVISKWLGLVHFLCYMLTSYHWFYLSQSHFRIAPKRPLLLNYCKSATVSKWSDLHPRSYKCTFHQIKNTTFS